MVRARVKSSVAGELSEIGVLDSCYHGCGKLLCHTPVMKATNSFFSVVATCTASSTVPVQKQDSAILVFNAGANVH